MMDSAHKIPGITFVRSRTRNSGTPKKYERVDDSELILQDGPADVVGITSDMDVENIRKHWQGTGI